MKMDMELEYRLRWLDFDRYGRINPVTVLDLFQDVATLHAEEMGIGRDDLLPRGVFWAIVRMKYEVLSMPKHYQTVRVRAWPHTPTGFSFLRDFTMSDESGNVLIKATSEWVIVDIESRKFVKMKDYYTGPTDFIEDRAFPTKPRKIGRFEDENRPVYEVVPAFSDIDVNGHVNNARYLRFVMDALNPDEEGAIRTLQIDYRHEVLPNEPLHIHSLVQDGTVMCKGMNANGEVAFACAMEIDG